MEFFNDQISLFQQLLHWRKKIGGELTRSAARMNRDSSRAPLNNLYPGIANEECDPADFLASLGLLHFKIGDEGSWQERWSQYDGTNAEEDLIFASTQGNPSGINDPVEILGVPFLCVATIRFDAATKHYVTTFPEDGKWFLYNDLNLSMIPISPECMPFSLYLALFKKIEIS